MKKHVLCLVAVLALLLALPAGAQARRGPLIFQTMPYNSIEVTAGAGQTAEFQYLVELVRSFEPVTEADCTLVVYDRSVWRRLDEVRRIHLGLRPVVHYLACNDPSPPLVTDTWQVDLKRGYYEWFISATITLRGVQVTNTMGAMNPLVVD